MAWLYLIIAGLLEIGWAIGLKYTHGFSRLWPSIATGACMIVSFAFLSLSLKTIPIGTGYAVWTGIGAAGTALFGIAMLGEPRDLGEGYALTTLAPKMVEAAGVEPASLFELPAATTCLVRREFQLPDNVLTRIRPPSRHEIFSASRAPAPRFAQPAVAFVHRSRRPVANVTALRPRVLVLD
jgi:quaternary ammonium compound-resistance protein SugE